MGKVLAGVALGALALLAGSTALLWTPDTDPEAMRARYVTADDAFVEADGMAVRMRVTGPADAPAVVLIHGTSASLETWEPLRARLEDRFRVVAYDQPGHGLTGPHPERDYTYAGMAEGLDAVLAAEGIERAVLIGSSMGGWVAWRDALKNPDRVRALVLIGAFGVPVEKEPEGALGFTLAQNPAGRLVLRKVTPRALVEASIRDTVSREELVTDEMTDRYWTMLRYPGNRQALADQFRTERGDLSGRLGEVTQPTLLLWGEKDRLVPLAAGEGFEERMPNARLITYRGIGHLPHEEMPDRVAADVLAFLDGLPE
jgi:pimeloyl-ACP methyl ester carboxylesterase